MNFSDSFNHLFLRHWDTLLEKTQTNAGPIYVDGHNLDLASVLVVARYGGPVEIDTHALQSVLRSAEAVHNSISQGKIVYGINTGYGGNADTRTQAIVDLQRGLIRGLHYGILATPASREAPPEHTTLPNLLQITALPLDEPSVSTCMPEAWTRASMLVRLNSLSIGASGVRPDLLKSLVQLLNKDVIPMVPLRGSISASGDLSPLSYIGGLMQGKPALKAYIGSRSQGLRHVIRADEALIEAGIDSIDVGPKEGLAIVNGTAPSTAVAALALHEAHCLTFLSQILTGMSVEALRGSDEQGPKRCRKKSSSFFRA